MPASPSAPSGCRVPPSDPGSTPPDASAPCSVPPTDEDLRRLAALVPGWEGCRLELTPLVGGLTNHNFRVSGPPEDHVLRLLGDAELLGADRRAEYAATVTAAGLGIAGLVVCYLPAERALVTHFIDGSPVGEDEMRTPAMLRAVAATLRRLHDAPPIDRTFSSFAIVESYRDAAAGLGVPLPSAYGSAWARLAPLRPLLDRRGGERLCHNDLLTANFLRADGRLRILDWEYAGMGDVFFDLANFASNHELGDEQERMLLAAYLGRDAAEDRARLHLMRALSDLREAMWGVVQQGLRTTDFDAAAYAETFFGRLDRRLDDPAFERAAALLAESTTSTGAGSGR